MRKRASLNLGDLEEFKSDSAKKPISEKIARDTAIEEGFTSRQVKPTRKIDGRSLRATNRNSQLNMAVKSETKERFWLMAKDNGYTAGEDFLIALMDSYNRDKP